jgi:hypothetical protein
MADQNPPMPDIIAGIIRHLLTAAGGVLVAGGYLTSDQWTTIAGALAIIVGVVWSVIAKRAASDPSGTSGQ